jgi:hypothetical protein
VGEVKEQKLATHTLRSNERLELLQDVGNIALATYMGGKSLVIGRGHE